jgi:hypothetical protein
MQVRIQSRNLDWHLVNGLNYAVDVSLRDDGGPILFLTKNEIQVTILGEKLNA